MNNRLLLFIAILVGVLSWLLSLWFGVHAACVTYQSTPDIVDFEHFAIPFYSGHQGKFAFLLGPSVTVFIAGAVLLLIRRSWLERGTRFQLHLLQAFPLRAVLAGVAGLLFLLVTLDHASRAEAAAARIHWHGSSPLNSVVNVICLPFAQGE